MTSNLTTDKQTPGWARLRYLLTFYYRRRTQPKLKICYISFINIVHIFNGQNNESIDNATFSNSFDPLINDPLIHLHLHCRWKNSTTRCLIILLYNTIVRMIRNAMHTNTNVSNIHGLWAVYVVTTDAVQLKVKICPIH